MNAAVGDIERGAAVDDGVGSAADMVLDDGRMGGFL
jgi:hypothetical protein